jgi:hypothetical protein
MLHQKFRISIKTSLECAQGRSHYPANEMLERLELILAYHAERLRRPSRRFSIVMATILCNVWLVRDNGLTIKLLIVTNEASRNTSSRPLE